MKCGFVALAGRTNVGKSALMNALVGTKVAIVTDRSQTTTRAIRGIKTTRDHQIVFVDTPGFHKPKTSWGDELVLRARRAFADADVALVVVEPGDLAVGGTRYVLDAVEAAAKPAVLCVNKVDRHPPEKVEATERDLAAAHPFAAVVRTSAVRGTGLDALEAALVSLLPEVEAPIYPPEQVLDEPRDLALAEVIREKAMDVTRDEVPHAIAVRVDSVEERETGTLAIAATIHVERESQKGIVIGKGGQTIKTIGTRAREELELRIGRKLFLELRVKVSANWRESPRAWKALGYA